MKLLVTGGCGFLGANLAREALKRKICLTVFDNLSRLGSSENLAWLRKGGEFDFVHGDISNQSHISRVISDLKPDFIFHLAGQVAMTTSINDPRRDFEINALGSFNVLDSVRQWSPHSCIIYSSTNKVYGDLEQFTYQEDDMRYVCNERPDGFDENTCLDFRSPYGCSKGAADQYMLDYARIFGLKTAVFRHSSMYGGRQFATYDQGWIGWFCKKAVDAQNGKTDQFTISGNGKQVRDVLHADDMVSLYFSAIQSFSRVQGQAFNIGGGMHNSLSLLELLTYLQSLVGVQLNFKQLQARSSDQKVFVANLDKIKRCLDWKPEVTAKEGIPRMLDWVRNML